MFKLLTMILTLILLNTGTDSFAQDNAKVESAENIATSNDIYRIQVRVIYGGKTGMFGTVPQELQDMRTLLTQAFRYPSYELANSIRVSLFGDEEAIAQVYPEFYLRLIPKGGSSTGLKIKAELFHIPDDRDTRTKYYLGNLPGEEEIESLSQNFPVPLISVEERDKDNTKPLMPILGSAMILTQQDWEAVGGVPVRVSGQSIISPGSSSLSAGGSGRSGVMKYLILGIKLEQR